MCPRRCHMIQVIFKYLSRRWAYLLVLVPIMTDWLDTGHLPVQPREYIDELNMLSSVIYCYGHSSTWKSSCPTSVVFKWWHYQAIRRDSQILPNPHGEIHLCANDVLFVLGPPEKIAGTTTLFHNSEEREVSEWILYLWQWSALLCALSGHALNAREIRLSLRAKDGKVCVVNSAEQICLRASNLVIGLDIKS